jgi:uncharacterized lipoprotein YmbA
MILTRRTSAMAIAAATLLAATLAGCHALPPLQYYALEAVNPVGTASPAGSAWLIHVRHVGLPHEMDHLGLTHQTDATRLAISDYDQWTAPLNVLIQATMTRDLGARLGYEHVVAVDAVPVVSHPGPDQPASTPSALDLDFVFLSADQGCGISAQVNWTLSVPNGAARRGTIHLAAPASGCPAGLPSALSTALGDLADQLVRQLAVS